MTTMDNTEEQEWIHDWDYERILPAKEGVVEVVQEDLRDEDMMDVEDMNLDDDDECEFVDNDDPIPVDQSPVEEEKDIVMFWARVPKVFDEFSDDDDSGLQSSDEDVDFDLVPQEPIRRDSLLFTQDRSPPAVSHHQQQQQQSYPHNDDASSWAPAEEAEDQDDSMMSPLEPDEGLLPEMSPQFRQPKAAVTAWDPASNGGTGPPSIPMPSGEGAPAKKEGGGAEMHDRQQKLLQEVLQQPARQAPPPLPHVQPVQQELYRELKGAHQHYEQNKPPTIAALKDETEALEKEDPIFARQREIFQELRASGKKEKEEAAAAAAGSVPSSYSMAPPSWSEPSHHPHHYHGQTPTRPRVHHMYPSHYAHPHQQQQQQQQHYMRPGAATFQYHQRHPEKGGVKKTSSPVSVTKTLTRAGLDEQDYKRITMQLAEKNLLERQRHLLQASMQRSLSSRQALLVKTTPQMKEYEGQERLLEVLKDVESSSDYISRTYDYPPPPAPPIAAAPAAPVAQPSST